MLALQLLLALGLNQQPKASAHGQDALVVPPPGSCDTTTRAEGKAARPAAAVPRCSPRKVLLAIRAVCLGRRHVRDQAFGVQLSQACREYRPERTSAKAKRDHPGRAPHKSPKPPKCLPVPSKARALAMQHLGLQTEVH